MPGVMAGGSVQYVAGGMVLRLHGSCPLAVFGDGFRRLWFDYPLVGCVPAEPASVLSKMVSVVAWVSGWWRRGAGRVRHGNFVASGLHEDGVDLAEIDDFHLIANGFYQRAGAEVFNGSKGSFEDAQDEVDGFIGEGLVWEADEVELLVDVGGQRGGGEKVEFGGVGDAAFEVEVVAELEGGVEGWLADEDEVVVFREVF